MAEVKKSLHFLPNPDYSALYRDMVALIASKRNEIWHVEEMGHSNHPKLTLNELIEIFFAYLRTCPADLLIIDGDWESISEIHGYAFIKILLQRLHEFCPTIPVVIFLSSTFAHHASNPPKNVIPINNLEYHLPAVIAEIVKRLDE